MLHELHVAVVFIGILLAVASGSGSGDEVSADVCRLPNGNFPNPDSCASFVTCQSGEPEVEQCPDGLLFNPFIMTCDFSVTGACSNLEDFNSTSVSLPTNDIDCSTDKPTATNIYLIQSSCSEYYLCNDEAAFLVKCPSGLLMNSEKLTCDYEENVECDITSITDKPSVVGIKADYENNDEENIKANTESVTDSETSSNMDSVTQTETSTTTPESALFTSTKSQFNVPTSSTENIRKPSELTVTEDVTTEQTSLKQIETSSSSISEYTANQQSTDLSVSTGQTKEEEIEATSKTATISSITTESTLGYMTTINEQATSSDTTNPYPDFTNTNDYFTQTNQNEQSESQTDSVATTKSGNSTSQEMITTAETKASSDIAATEFSSIFSESTVTEKFNDTKIIEEEYIVVDQTTKLEEKETDLPYRSTLANDTKTNLNSVNDFESSSPVTVTEITSTVMSSSILSTESTKEEIASSPTTSIEQFATSDQTERISPEKTISTTQSLMSSDPSTDETNENITSSKYSTFTEPTSINTRSSTDVTALSSTNELPDEITMYTETTQTTTMNVEKQTEGIQSSVSDVQEDTSDSRSKFDVSNGSSTFGTLENLTSDTLVTESEILTVHPTTNEPNITTNTHINEDLSTKVSSNLPVVQTDTDSGISIDPSSSTTESTGVSDITSFEKTTIKISTDIEFTSAKETPTTLAEQTTPVSEVQETTFPSSSSASIPANDTDTALQRSTPTSVSIEKVTTQISDVDLSSTEENTKKNADDIFTQSTLSSSEFSDFSGSGSLDDETTQTLSSDYSTVTKFSTQSRLSSISNTEDDTNVNTFSTGFYDSTIGQSDDVQNSTLSTDNQETSTISINSIISETTTKHEYSSNEIIDFETTSENIQSTYKTESDISDSSLTFTTPKRFSETDEHEITDLNTKTSSVLPENDATEQTKSSDEIPTSTSNVYASSTTENYTFVPTLQSDVFTFDSTTESKSTGFSGITDLTTNKTNFDDVETTVMTTKFRDTTSTISSEGVSDFTFSTIPSANFDDASEKTNTQPNITTNTDMSSEDEKISSTVRFETPESTPEPDTSSVTVFEITTQDLESESPSIQGLTSFSTDESTIDDSNSSPAIADEITSNEEKSTYVSTTDSQTSSVIVTDFMSSTKIRDFNETSESPIMTRSTLEQTTSNETDITSKLTTNADLTFANETTPTAHSETPEGASESNTPSIIDFESTTDDFESSSTSLINSVSFNTDESTIEQTSSMLMDNITNSEEKSTSKSTAEFETTSDLVTEFRPSTKVIDLDITSESTITTRATSDKTDITAKISTNTDPTVIDETTSTVHFETSKSISESNTPSTVDLEITTEYFASSSTSLISSISFNTDEITTENTSSSMIMDNITNSEEKSTRKSTDEFETTSNLVTEFRPSTSVIDLDVTSESTITTRATSDKTDITANITTNTDPTFTDETTSTAHFETSKGTSESKTPSTVDFEITTEDIESRSTSFISSIYFNTDESTTERTSSSMIIDNITNNEEKSTPKSTADFETTSILVTDSRPATKVIDLDVTSESTITTRIALEKTTTELLEDTSVTIDSSSITSSTIFDSVSESSPQDKTFFPDNLITESTTDSSLDYYTANTTLDAKDKTDGNAFTVTDLASLSTKDTDSSTQGKTDTHETSESSIITTALEETSKSNFADETTRFTTTESSTITSTINSDDFERTSESSTSSKFIIDQKTTPAKITSESNTVITDDFIVDVTTLTSSPAHFDDTSETTSESTVFKEETTGLSDVTTLTTSSSSTTSIIDNISEAVTDTDFTGKYSTAVETSSSVILTSEDLKTDDYSLITESTSTDKTDVDSPIVTTQTEGTTLESTSSTFSEETLSTRISDISSTVQSDDTSKRERTSTISKSFETTPYDTISPKTETISDLETSTSETLSSTLLNTGETSTDLTLTKTFPTPKDTSRRVTEFETSVSDIMTESSITALSSKYSTTEGIITITDQNSIENFTTIASTTKESATTDNEDDESITESQVIPTTVKFSVTTTTLNPICLKPNGFFPNPDDCKTFYQCSKGVPKLSNCIGNNHFSPISKMCEDRCQAKCEPSADCPTTEGETSSDETTVASTTSREKSISSTSVSETTETEGSSESTTDAFEIQKSTSEPDELTSITDSKTTVSDITSNFTSTSSSTLEIETTNYVSSSSATEESSIPSDSATEETTSVLNVSTTETTTASVPFYILSSTSGETTSFISIDDTTTSSYVTDSPTSKIPLITKTTVKISTTREYTEKPSSESDETSSESDETSSESVETTQTTKCKNRDCLSSKVPALSSTPLPFILCNRNDFVSRPQCNEYMDCTERYPKKKVCPMGLHFNPTSRVCDWPYIAGCGKIPNPLYVPDTSFKCPCRSCLVPSSTSCSKYYLCLGYTPYQMKCSNNLYFDKNLMTCNYAGMVECFISTSSTTVSTKKPTTISTTKSTTRRPATTTKKPSTTSKPQKFACPRREGLFKYPGDCGKFYQCSNWFPYEMRCAPSTHFSEISNRCDWPCDAKCDLSLSCGASLQHSTVAPRDPQCSCLNCKLPSPETCTKYIVCTKGRARIENCPRGQTFDEKRSHCDWAHKVKCSHSEMCPELNGLFPHKDDCHKFVHCSNGIPYVKKCPYILEFDSVKKRCEWPNGRCNNSPATKEFDIFKAEEHKEGWECPKTFGYFSDDVHCNRFYRCSQGTPALKECSEGLLYNPRLQTCDWKGHVRCNINRHQTPKRCRIYDRNLKCPSDRTPQPHTLCGMYYDCTDGRACAKQCPVGLYFNRKTGMCDLPANVKCFLGGEEEYSLKEFSSSCQSSSHHKRIANPTDDSCFYYCRQGKVISDCCSRSHVYNEHKDKCERRTKSFRL